MQTVFLALLAVTLGASGVVSAPPGMNNKAVQPTPAQVQYRRQCDGKVFPAIYPPTQAEKDCHKLQYEAQCEGMSFIETSPPSEAEMKCRRLEYQTTCEGEDFPVTDPPSGDQQRCQILQKSLMGEPLSEGETEKIE